MCKEKGGKNSQAGHPRIFNGRLQVLTARQLRARLEVYKKNNCPNCEKRYECDYGMFVQCKKIK
jgi:hypothetical protein